MSPVKPREYASILDLRETQKAIKLVKDFFQTKLAEELCLTRVSAPLFVKAGTGVNDDLNGVEAPVSFTLSGNGGETAEIVQSLAKWKRMALADYGFSRGEGLYTDMCAIRPDEVTSCIHSVYVDQWDWERVISQAERSLDFLKRIVGKIYAAIKATEACVCEQYTGIEPLLPDEIYFIHSEELHDLYPDLTPRQREDAIAREKGAVFVIGIGAPLKDGEPHDGRAPDYDDWSTPTSDSTKGLDGDILVWHPVLGRALELSSMGIRVDEEALLRQLEIRGCTERRELHFHKRLLGGELPLSVGGGIGQSRLCMFFLRKAHIGEVQASVWPDDMVLECKSAGIPLL